MAYSGGVDSTLLVKVCRDLLGEKAIAVTVVSPLLPSWELDDARSMASRIGIKHILLEEKTIAPAVSGNTPDRCYHCKKSALEAIHRVAEEKGFRVVLDGSNSDDIRDYRPGAKAVRELQVISPLQVAGLHKNEIRCLSKALGLSTWDKPAYACLASRIPYGEEVTAEKLERVERAESFRDVRVRGHSRLARIEVGPDDRRRFCDPATMDRVSRQLKGYGFLYVCLELEGYSMSSLNRLLPEQ